MLFLQLSQQLLDRKLIYYPLPAYVGSDISPWILTISLFWGDLKSQALAQLSFILEAFG